jgi:ATP synthase protein I
LQGVVVTCIAAGFLFTQGIHLAASVLSGGLLWLVPNWVFAWVWLGYFKASAASRLVTLFYVAEVIKLVLIGLLFVFMLKYLHPSMVGCLIGMVCAQIAAWLAPIYKY